MIGAALGHRAIGHVLIFTNPSDDGDDPSMPPDGKTGQGLIAVFKTARNLPAVAEQESRHKAVAAASARLDAFFIQEE